MNMNMCILCETKRHRGKYYFCQNPTVKNGNRPTAWYTF